MTVEEWLANAVADADRRGLSGLAPLLETLARSTGALREAEAALREAEMQTPAPGGDHDRA
jgi:hypothetical protein